MRKGCFFTTICLFALIPLSSPASAADNCATLFDKVEAGGQTLSTDQLKTYYQESLKTGDCTDDFRRALGRRVAVAIANQVDQATTAGQSLESQEATLTDSLNYHRLWQVLATLGDIARDRDDHTTATKRFQESLEAISDTGVTKTAPPKKTIEAIFKKAETSRMLAKTFVATPKNRAGEPTGLGSLNIRGFTPNRVAIPITFEYDSVAFTREGARAAEDMITQLTSQGSPDILLVGHTDARGAFGYNQYLSELRANSVRTFLLESGYQGKVRTIGRGEDDPFLPDDPSRYHMEQIHQMNRRVELQR